MDWFLDLCVREGGGGLLGDHCLEDILLEGKPIDLSLRARTQRRSSTPRSQEYRKGSGLCLYIQPSNQLTNHPSLHTTIQPSLPYSIPCSLHLSITPFLPSSLKTFCLHDPEDVCTYHPSLHTTIQPSLPYSIPCSLHLSSFPPFLLSSFPP
jgi:hypothetical protein